MKSRDNRDEVVLATKYTTGWLRPRGRNIIQSNYGGMNAKSLKHTLDSSLKKLQTTYLDILYIHWWDHGTEITEVMHALNDMVRQGKVIYLGISDTPAW
jgi:aryl-alcohol dehydrogenase-like predicted oxidoreductase